MKKASLLYFLKDRSGPYRKIGLAVDVERRISQLPDDIDRSDSYVVECLKRASDVERSLHHLFSAFRIRKEHGGDGHTEWFAEECFDAIRRFIEENRAILGVGPFLPIGSVAPQSGEREIIKPGHSRQPTRRWTRNEFIEAVSAALHCDDNKNALQYVEEFFGKHALLKWPTANPSQWGMVLDTEPDRAATLKLYWAVGHSFGFSTLLTVHGYTSFLNAQGNTHYSCRISVNDDPSDRLRSAYEDYVAAVERILEAIPTVVAPPGVSPGGPAPYISICVSD